MAKTVACPKCGYEFDPLASAKRYDLWSKEEDDVMFKMHREGASYGKIALEIGRTYEAVRAHYKRATAGDKVWSQKVSISAAEYDYLKSEKKKYDKIVRICRKILDATIFERRALMRELDAEVRGGEVF